MSIGSRRETKTDPLESISSGEVPPPTAGVVKSASIKSDLVGFFGWVESLNGFGQLYSLPFFFSKRYVSYIGSKYEIVRIQEYIWANCYLFYLIIFFKKKI